MKNANVFVDVDLTLVDANLKLLEGAKEGLQRLHDRGCHLFLWSTAGADYCRKIANLHKLEHLFEGFTAKPDIIIDDMPATCVTQTGLRCESRRIVGGCFGKDSFKTYRLETSEFLLTLRYYVVQRSVRTLCGPLGQRALPRGTTEAGGDVFGFGAFVDGKVDLGEDGFVRDGRNVILEAAQEGGFEWFVLEEGFAAEFGEE